MTATRKKTTSLVGTGTLEERLHGGAVVPVAANAWNDADRDVDTGIDDVEPSHPIIKLVQAVSQMGNAGKHGGEFWRSDTETFHPELTLVPIRRQVTRGYFDGGEKPACVSDDGRRPRLGMPLWEKGGGMPSLCRECPLSYWGPDKTPPECKESWLFLCVDENHELAQLRVSGKNIGVWNQYISRRLRPRNLPLFSHAVTIRAERRSQAGNTWYEMVLTPRPLTPAEAAPFGLMLARERSRVAEPSLLEEPHLGPDDELTEDIGD